MLVHRLFLGRWIPKYAVWVIALAAMAFGSALPSYFGIARGVVEWEAWGKCQYGNVFALFDDEYRPAYIMFALIWSCLITILNGRWAIRQVMNFLPMDKTKSDKQVDEG